ncbi:MAG: hypothetical protein ACOCW1_03920 [Chitinispirillaceae bacterium]
MSSVSYIDPERKSSTVSSATVSAFFLKQVYASMLHSMELAPVRYFWDTQWECAKNTFPNKSDFYFRLWQAQTRFDFKTIAAISENLEKFASGQNTDTAHLIENAFHYGRNLTESARYLLHQTAPILQTLLTAEDTRKQILLCVDHLNEKFITGIRNTLLDHTLCGELYETRFMLSYPEDEYCPGFNSELWIVLIIKYLPALFSLSPFENHFMLSDCRGVKKIVPQAGITNDMLIIGGEIYGRVNSFYDFCKRKSLLLKALEYRIPNIPVVELERDYVCPKTQRILLYKGCAYDAPAVIYGFRYRPHTGIQKNNLERLIETATAQNSALDAEVNRKHTLLMKSIQSEAEVKYFRADESISVNGSHLVKSVPAKILRHIITSYLHSGKTDFEYKDFAKQKDIVMDSTNPNIAIRLRRLSLVLENNFPQLNIIMNGRGKFKIEVNCDLSYSEN